jgi:flavin-binding protein dodecin
MLAGNCSGRIPLRRLYKRRANPCHYYGSAVQSRVRNQDQGEPQMAQKVIDVVGTSKESFAKAAENAVTEAAKTVRGMQWARVAELEMELDGKKIVKYRTTTKIYFDIEK